MPKKLTKTQQPFSQVIHRHHILRNFIVALILATLVIYGLGLWYLFHENDVRSAESFAQMVTTSIDRMSAPAPIDARSGNVYFHQTSLMLPPFPQNTMAMGLNYFYTPAFEQTGLQLQLISRSDVSSAEARLRNDPMTGSTFDAAYNNDLLRLQACAQGLLLTYDKMPAPDASKVLSNGKTLYFYWDTDHRCVNSDLLNYAEQVAPY